MSGLAAIIIHIIYSIKLSP